MHDIQCRQMGYLDTVTQGVEVSRQDLDGYQYRWTVTFLDEGDDFDLVLDTNALSGAVDDAAITVTTRKVCFG